jgi:hypothetical protein
MTHAFLTMTPHISCEQATSRPLFPRSPMDGSLCQLKRQLHHWATTFQPTNSNNYTELNTILNLCIYQSLQILPIRWTSQQLRPIAISLYKFKVSQSLISKECTLKLAQTHWCHATRMNPSSAPHLAPVGKFISWKGSFFTDGTIPLLTVTAVRKLLALKAGQSILSQAVLSHMGHSTMQCK